MTTTGGTSTGGGGGDASCSHPDAPEVVLRVTRGSLGPERVFALVEIDDGAGGRREVALLVDTGSQVSFLSNPGGPDYLPDFATVYLGCSELRVGARPFVVDESIDGRPTVGFLGADFFLAQLRELDLEAEVVRRVEDGPAVPEGWATVPFEDLFGFVFVRVALDGVAVRLGVDTGAVHALWLGQEGQPGDQPVSTQDADGTPLTLYLGEAALDVGAGGPGPVVVPTLRAPSFPSLEESNEELGGDIQGLFGLTTIAAMGPRVRIDAAGGVISFGPAGG